VSRRVQAAGSGQAGQHQPHGAASCVKPALGYLSIYLVVDYGAAL
jgi:hypothetical protein